MKSRSPRLCTDKWTPYDWARKVDDAIAAEKERAYDHPDDDPRTRAVKAGAVVVGIVE